MNKVATAKEVLWNARKQIPNALVLYVGFFFSVYFQADEESRRNQLMRDMAQLRLQVREAECWLISVVKSKGSEMTNQRWNGFIGVHVMVNNFHFLSTNKTSDFMWFWRIIYNSKRTEVSTDATIGIFNCPSICRHMT